MNVELNIVPPIFAQYIAPPEVLALLFSKVEFITFNLIFQFNAPPLPLA